jgi:hypothetical protein
LWAENRCRASKEICTEGDEKPTMLDMKMRGTPYREFSCPTSVTLLTVVEAVFHATLDKRGG